MFKLVRLSGFFWKNYEIYETTSRASFNYAKHKINGKFTKTKVRSTLRVAFQKFITQNPKQKIGTCHFAEASLNALQFLF